MSDDKSAAILGSFDGATSLVGFLAGALAVHANAQAIMVEASALAVAAAVSMASGYWLSGKPVGSSLIMGLATLLGSLVPAVPVIFLPGFPGVLFAAFLFVVLAAVIAEVRTGEDVSRLRSYVSTFCVVLVAGSLAAGVSLGLGVSG